MRVEATTIHSSPVSPASFQLLCSNEKKESLSCSAGPSAVQKHQKSAPSDVTEGANHYRSTGCFSCCQPSKHVEEEPGRAPPGHLDGSDLI